MRADQDDVLLDPRVCEEDAVQRDAASERSQLLFRGRTAIDVGDACHVVGFQRALFDRTRAVRNRKHDGSLAQHRPPAIGAGLRLADCRMAQTQQVADFMRHHAPEGQHAIRGRGERNFGTWQGRLPQELRLAGITRLEQPNQFLRERYIAIFSQKFKVEAAERGTAFRRTARADLEWVFTVQTERVVSKDNTVTIGQLIATKIAKLGENISVAMGKNPTSSVKSSSRRARSNSSSAASCLSIPSTRSTDERGSTKSNVDRSLPASLMANSRKSWLLNRSW